MNATLRNIIVALAFVLAVPVVLGAIEGVHEMRAGTVVEHTTTVQTNDDVTSFNNGYAEAMDEACKAGSAYACDWSARTAK